MLCKYFILALTWYDTRMDQSFLCLCFGSPGTDCEDNVQEQRHQEVFFVFFNFRKTPLMGLAVEMHKEGCVYCEQPPGNKIHKHTFIYT